MSEGMGWTGRSGENGSALAPYAPGEDAAVARVLAGICAGFCHGERSGALRDVPTTDDVVYDAADTDAAALCS